MPTFLISISHIRTAYHVSTIPAGLTCARIDQGDCSSCWLCLVVLYIYLFRTRIHPAYCHTSLVSTRPACRMPSIVSMAISTGAPGNTLMARRHFSNTVIEDIQMALARHTATGTNTRGDLHQTVGPAVPAEREVEKNPSTDRLIATSHHFPRIIKPVVERSLESRSLDARCSLSS